MSDRKGLILDVLRNAHGDYTNDGISATHESVTVTGIRRDHGRDIELLPEGSRVFAPTTLAPEVTLVIRESPSGHYRWMHLEPVSPRPEGHVGYMAGGNYATTSDSRWRKLTGGADALPVHDRTETAAQYAALSI